MAQRRHRPDNSIVIVVAFAAGAASMLLIVLALMNRPSTPPGGRARTEAQNAPTAPALRPPVPVGRPMALPQADPPAVPDPPTAVGPPIRDEGRPWTPAEAIDELRDRYLLLPVAGAATASLQSSFTDARPGDRSHEAIDILAPRDTPVRAVEDGVIAKLFLSEAGGRTIYQFDPTEWYAYYYAHLERYAPGLEEGDAVTRGQTIGYVGTSGNAPPDTPHLHFAVFRLDRDRRWWEGEPIDPYLIWRD